MVRILFLAVLTAVFSQTASANCSSSDIKIAGERLQDYLDDRATAAVVFQNSKNTVVSECSKSGETISAVGTYYFKDMSKTDYSITGSMALYPDGDVQEFHLTGASPNLINAANKKGGDAARLIGGLR